jgi:Post-segregation antitoxin CcdA
MRPPNNSPESGYNAGRLKRAKDVKRGTYPLPNLPGDAADRPREYIDAYSQGYYNPRRRGGQPVDDPKAPLSVKIDPILLATARQMGINLGAACEQGLRNAIEGSG